MYNSDKNIEMISALDNAKYKITELQSKNKAMENKIRELENENRWLKIFAYKSKRTK